MSAITSLIQTRLSESIILTSVRSKRPRRESKVLYFDERLYIDIVNFVAFLMAKKKSRPFQMHLLRPPILPQLWFNLTKHANCRWKKGALAVKRRGWEEGELKIEDLRLTVKLK